MGKFCLQLHHNCNIPALFCLWPAAGKSESKEYNLCCLFVFYAILMNREEVSGTWIKWSHSYVAMNSSLANTTMKGNDQIKKSHSCIPSESSQILHKCCIRRNLKGKHSGLLCSFSSESHVLLTVEVFEMAQAQILDHTSKKEDDPSIASQPLNWHSDLSLEVSYDLQLALLLQASAEMFSKRRYERATELLSLCNLSASPTGTPDQRVVYCYSEALRERINKETKSITGLQLDRLVDFEVKTNWRWRDFLVSKASCNCMLSRTSFLPSRSICLYWSHFE